MDDKDEILELDLDFDLTQISPDEVLDSLGLSDATMEELLDLLKKGAEEAKTGLANFTRSHMREYHGIGKRHAAIAFAIYDRLMKKDEEPRIPTRLAVNRFKSTGCFPDTIIFWNDPDSIRGLYESLEKDGYYASSPRA